MHNIFFLRISIKRNGQDVPCFDNTQPKLQWTNHVRLSRGPITAQWTLLQYGAGFVKSMKMPHVSFCSSHAHTFTPSNFSPLLNLSPSKNLTLNKLYNRIKLENNNRVQGGNQYLAEFNMELVPVEVRPFQSQP